MGSSSYSLWVEAECIPLKPARAHPLHHVKPVCPPEDLNHVRNNLNHIRKAENNGIHKTLTKPSLQRNLDKTLDLSEHVDRHDVQVSEKFLYQRLQVCIDKKDLELGRQVHAFIKRCGQHSNAFLGSHLIRMFSCCGSLPEAYVVFSKLPAQNVFTWSAIISAYANYGQGDQACNLFKEMLQSRIKPDECVFVVVLKACASITSLLHGKLIHAHIIDCGFELNIFVANTLIGMYASCGSLADGCTLFGQLSKQNVATWNAMIAAYLQHGDVDECVQLFQQMQKEGMKPNNITCVSILKACSYITLGQTKFFHLQIVESGLELDTYVASTLIDVYAKHGSIDDAREVFDKLPTRDLVTWSTIIAGYVQNGKGQEALMLFQHMQLTGGKADNVIYVSVLNACSTTAAVDQGQVIYACLIYDESPLDVFLGSALINMYASHGKLVDAQRVFTDLPQRDVGVWNAMIEGCTTNSNHELAIHYFEGMQSEGLMPDEVTFVCLLSLCSHMGLVEEAWYQLKLMIGRYGMTPLVEHYNCIIDLLGRSGQLDEAENVLQNMPWQPTIKSWMALLSNCKNYGNVEVGRRCFKHVILIDCTQASAYTLMWALFSGAGLWMDALKIEELRTHAHAWKKPGKAYIEVGQKLHEFVVGDKSHPLLDACYRKLKSLFLHGNTKGCIPQLDFLLAC